MNRGSVLFWPNFEFHDGGTANKLLVVLNNADNNDHVLFFKTTSQSKGRERTPGCNSIRQEYFLLPQHGEFLVDTWIILNEVYAYTFADVLRITLGERKFDVKGVLSSSTVDNIRDCALLCLDIERKWKRLLMK